MQLCIGAVLCETRVEERLVGLAICVLYINEKYGSLDSHGVNLERILER